ncbi:hypothetical protein F383_37420 [Gossypium arboreum]|uniref:Uncharacterized protein n=1 Tax=Gossypium arboreum TaxID=29729 RepID=A0A0B0MBD2_GOSAR|nr:hypothetical protein F383_37420 [Gossypium arboreum]
MKVGKVWAIKTRPIFIIRFCIIF